MQQQQPQPVPASPPVSAAPSGSKLRLPLPTKFDGDPKLCRGFITQCSMHLELMADPDRTSEGGVCGKPLVPFWDHGDPISSNLMSFLAEFRSVFEEPAQASSAETALLNLSQGIMLFSFAPSLQNWHGTTKPCVLHLKKDALAACDPPTNLCELVHLATRIDAHFPERQEELFSGKCLHLGHVGEAYLDVNTISPSLIIPVQIHASAMTSFFASAFLDSGSTGNFIDASLVHEYHLPVTRLAKSLFISSVNGQNLDCKVDASSVGIGAIVTQKNSNGKSVTCGFLSKTFLPAERNYSIGDRELLAIKLLIEEWRHLLEGSPHLTRHSLALVFSRMKTQTDKKRRPPPSHKVWLSSMYIRFKIPSYKLGPRFLGLLQKINPVSYKLCLPSSLCIPNSFHVSFLKPLTQNFEGSTDELGVCHCSVVLPDSTFPADRFEMLEISNWNLSITVQKEITKIQHYESTLIIYMERLINLTKRVEVMEMGGLSYTELDFELVKLEIKEIESLIWQLKISMNSTNVVVETLYLEIRNLSVLVNQLEVYDKNNVLVIRKEIAALKKRLEDCEKNETRPQPPLPPVNYGKCDHGEIMNITKPFIVQLNYGGSGNPIGGWGNDALLGADQSIHWVALVQVDNRIMYSIRIFSSYDSLLIYQVKEEKIVRTVSGNIWVYTNCGQGGGMVVFNNTLYYNCYNTQNLCKYNLQTTTVERRVLTDATYNNRFSYSSSAWQDIDFATDEDGLWVIYTTEADGGNIHIAKVNPITLEVMQTWATTQFKRGVTNAFMACGVLYATRALSTSKEEIFYMYDTKANKEGYLSVQFDKVKENIHSLNYNPNNHKLYMFNDAYMVTYDLTFKQLK
ncbi:olfactomedin-4-like [Hyla sarda]|uniref:olfactomedin-4-like n=1 Tax=Hyla sarda TaxID=327740 RepID=UPI0024C3F32B|nr:olfactomedin-4-like [Hyla sarda]